MPRQRSSTKRPQLEIEFVRRGGVRKNAGRKRRAPRPQVPHRRRPAVSRHEPQHVTLRVLERVGRLRRRDAYRAVRGAMVVMLRRTDFRIVHMSIQGTHIHLICEAHDRDALRSGIQGLKISAARRLNRALGHDGHVFSDRYHAEALTCPAQTRRAIGYVLNNWRRHGEDRGRTWLIDPYSSAIAFGGWRELGGGRFPKPPGYEPLPVRAPRSWLLRVGWQKAGPLSYYDVPGPRR